MNLLTIKIAKQSLICCITESGIVAGMHHFVDLWARDSLFATMGANVSGLSKASKKTIETFLLYQRSDGLVPYLILRSKGSIGKYFGKHVYYSRPKPVFRSHISFGIVPDGGILTIIAMRSYVEKTRDTTFLKKRYIALTKAFSWYEKKYNGELIREWFSCEWADATLKIGKTLYTNVLYFKAAKDLSWLATRLRKPKDTLYYETAAKKIHHMMHEEFWTGSYFADWIDYKRHNYFATHQNMLAVVFGLATKKEAISILDMAKRTAWNGWTLLNTNVSYPLWRIPFLHISIGMADYHNGLVWLQPGIMYAIALKKIGRSKEAKKVLQGIATKVQAVATVHEVYERSGLPVKRLVYTSEHPFAWSAGILLWAERVVFGTLKG